MDPQPPTAIERLYQAALAKEPGEREAFLATACAGDPTLRSAVQSLLADPGAKVEIGGAERETETMLRTMPPEAWETIERLFHGAIAKEPAQRLAYLDAACPPDPELRQLLESMLGYRRDAGGSVALPPISGPDHPSWPEGKQIGPYQIRQQVGGDVMGQVYEAHDTGADRTVALKSIRPEFAARFKGDGRAILNVGHSKICALYDAGQDDGVDYLVMEYVTGERLSRWLRRGPLPVHTALQYGIELCDALDYTHRQGIVHRDLKTSSIVVAGSGIKLLDFGTVKALDPAALNTERVLSAVSVMAETPACLSPEQLLGRPVDERSDVFAVGSILYEMVSGERPFSGASLRDTVAAVLSEDPRPLAHKAAPVPRELLDAVLRCLRKAPEERFAGIGDLKSALLAVQVQAPENRIGPYQVLRELGRGGMGIVYLARDPDIGREVAIKTIQLPPFTDPVEGARLRGRFLREARAAGSLSHPGIVTVHHLGEHEGQPYIVMEFVDGGSLERYMPGTPHAAKLEPLIRGLRTVAEALDFAHSRSIIHRDIKPGNILIGKTGAFKVADFGIAKILDESDLSTTRGVIGTPMFLAPEQLRGQLASARSDQYALGVIAYHIATRRPPFAARTTEELFFQIVSALPALPSSLNPDLDPSVDPILQRVLSKDPAERFATCAEFVAVLHEAVRRSVPKPKPAPPVRPVEPPKMSLLTEDQTAPSQFAQRHWKALGIGLALIVVVWLAAQAIRSSGSATIPVVQTHIADTASSSGTPPPPKPADGPEGEPGTVTVHPPPEAHSGAGSPIPPGAGAEPKAEIKAEPKGDPAAAEELYEALDKGYSIAAIQAILDHGPLLNGTRPDKVPLTMVALRCQTEAAKLLLAKGADPNAPYSTGLAAKFKSDAATPLTMAAFAGCADVAQLLLDHGAKPNLLVDDLSGAAASAHEPALVYAVQRSDYDRTDPKERHELIARLLLDHGADPNLHGKYGWPPLLHAASRCASPIAGWLLERNADVNFAEWRDGDTALMGAAAAGCQTVVAALIVKRAKVNQTDQEGRTALYHLVEFGHSNDDDYGKKQAIARELIKAGANPNLASRKNPRLNTGMLAQEVGITPLMLALRNGMGEMLRLLMENGADPNAADGEGQSALMHAVMNEAGAQLSDKVRVEAVELLLAHGAAVNARDKKGITALGYTKQHSGDPWPRIADILRKAGGVE